MSRDASLRLDTPEFFNVWVLSAVVLFGLNNFYWKAAYGNWLTGKLSDFLVCFFLPLFISALSNLFGVCFRSRIRAGVIITATMLMLVKLNPLASDLLNTLLTRIGEPLGLGQSLNRVDPTDLLALPVLGISYWFAKLHGGTCSE